MWFTKTIQNVLLNTIKSLFEDQRKQSDEKFEGIGKRLDGMEKRSDERFSEIDRQLGDIRVDIHDNHEKVMGAFDALTVVPELKEAVESHEGRIQNIEQNITVLNASAKNLHNV